MNAVALFLMLRERLSHSFVDGRLLTAAGPDGDDGLRHILAEPMVLEELAGRLPSLFRVGKDILGLRSNRGWIEVKEEMERNVSAIRSAVSGGSSTQNVCVRGRVLQIRELLRELGHDSFSGSAALSTVGGALGIFKQRFGKIVELIAWALDTDLSSFEATELAREFWTERLEAEEEIISSSLFVASGKIVVHDSIEEVLWSLRGFDEVAELAITCTRSLPDRRVSCERLLRGEVLEKLPEIAERAGNLVGRLLDSKG